MVKTNSKELGKTKEGWLIKIVINENSGKITYIGYFYLGSRKAPVMLSSDNLEVLKEKISKSKYSKHKNLKSCEFC